MLNNPFPRDPEAVSESLEFGKISGIKPKKLVFESREAESHRKYIREFEEQKRLFGILDEKWRLRKEKEHNELLISHPFSDNI